MSLYGYSDALSQGTSFNARVKNFNEGVLAHNQFLQDKYENDIKTQAGKVADDQTKKDEDEVLYGFRDGVPAIGLLASTGLATKDIYKKGFKGYVVDETKGRVNNIRNTATALVSNEKPPPPAEMELGEIGDDGKVVEGTAGRTVEEATNGVEAASNLAGDGAKAAEETASMESSGLMTAGIKKVLGATTRGAIGEAGLTTLSEIGGKAIGDYSGVIDIGKSIDNLINHKSVFSGESTADKFQEAGAAFDIVGTIFPPAELIGGALGLTGGIINTVNDLKGDMDKKNQDAATIDPPKQTAVKVSPAFQSMGLVASSLPSAKNQIVGGGSF
jgi:hypothetical protein